MKLFKYLCHQRPDRSFFYKEHQFPVCSRCTGFLIGIPIFSSLPFIYPIILNNELLIVTIISQIPYILDGLTQHLKLRESNNYIRFITGFIGAFGIIYIIKLYQFLLQILGIY